ncbi:MAG TPA: type II secretion system F family protein [Desulfuromonadaceae bacterium]|nr:type II secretion system F family protein [Desulfuromonadaceae bacterium]
MPQFSYKARRRSGELVEGTLDVLDRPTAVKQIERLGLFPIAVDASKGGGPGDKRSGPKMEWARFLPQPVREHFQEKRKPKLQELATFTQQLANLLQAGMPLSTALNSMTYLETKGIPGDVSRQLKQEVTEGRSLSDAMAKQPRVFSDLYVNMVKAGEQSGALVEVLRRMADHFEKFAQVQAKVTSSLIYPALVVCVGIAMIVFFLTVMLPKFMGLFGEMGSAHLPTMTVILINVSTAFKKFWWLMGLMLITAIILFKRYQSTPGGRRRIDQLKMKLPIFGRVISINLYGQFARTLCTLMENGVPVLTALKITEQVIPNVVLKEATAKTRDAVTDGKSLAQPLAASKVFPQLMIDLLRIGEETGKVSEALDNVATTYENELNIALRVMMNLIEPALIIGMAVLVGFLLVAILGAMFQMVSNIGNSMGGPGH